MDDFCKHDGSRILLVEGKNDCHVIMALCKYFNIPETFGIRQCEGDVGVLGTLDAYVPKRPMEVVGVVLDADTIPAEEQRWLKFTTIMKEHGYSLPDKPVPSGTILEKEGSPKIGVWIMPDNQKRGMLEDLLLEMVPPVSVTQARECVQSAEASGHTTFKQVHRSKAEIHTYLAWQDEPGMPMGRAITNRALDPNTVTAHAFKNWLFAMFL